MAGLLDFGTAQPAGGLLGDLFNDPGHAGIKAKLEAVASGIVTFEDEFATHMVLPDGHTVRDHLMPAIEQAYATGRVSPILAIGREGSS